MILGAAALETKRKVAFNQNANNLVHPVTTRKNCLRPRRLQLYYKQEARVGGGILVPTEKLKDIVMYIP